MIKPSRIIEDGYLLRWHLIPRNPYFNIFLHKFIGSDPGRCLHDHPWHSISILLKGDLYECTLRDPGKPPLLKTAAYMEYYEYNRVPRFIPVFRSARHMHTICLGSTSVFGKAPPAWTLFITGPVIRAWGFWLENKAWVHHSRYDVKKSTE